MLFLNRMLVAGILVMLAGCGSSTPPTSDSATSIGTTTGQSTSTSPEPVPPKPFVFEAPQSEATAEQLLASRLPESETRDGWVRLFDGHTLFGWTIAGPANWRVEDQTIVVDQGEKSLLNTSTSFADFELELEFKADAETNSGVFVRSLFEPENVQTDCYEINIAPASNPFPTGGIVQRKQAIALPDDFDDQAWHTMNVVCDEADITVTIDGEIMCQFDNARVPRRGFIGLQHNSGRAAFRNIRLRPLGLQSLLDGELTRWKRYPEMPGEFRVDDDGHLVVDGGKQQLESDQSYGNFALLAEYRLAAPESNSGIFFRSMPGAEMMGYECQVNDAIVDGNPLEPGDCGAGGIFRRQDARVVASQADRWNAIVLIADGPHIASWVNGLQVADFQDTREPHENPRKGLRTDPGTIIIQGHDPTTAATFRQISVAPRP